MVIPTERVIMFKMRMPIVTTTSTGVTIVIEMIEARPLFYLKIMKLFLRMVEVVWRELMICC